MPRRKSSRTQIEEIEANAKKAVIYARVSSKEQDREGFSIPAQIKLLNDHAAAADYKVEAEYIDVETAKQDGRTNFTAMIRFLRKHPSVKTILVEKTDRLYRNLKDWVTIDDLEVEVCFVKEGVTLSRDSRSSEKFMHGIKVLMAKNYIDNLSEEVRKGMTEKAAQGLWPSFAPLGYRNMLMPDGKRSIVPDPDVAPHVARLFEWYATGNYALKDIGRMARKAGFVFRKSGAGVPVSTIHKILRNRIYTGEFEWRGKVYEGKYEPLISKDLWNFVQDILNGRYIARHPQTGGGVREFAYTGLLTCGHCGCAMTAEIKKEKYIYYHCTGYRGKCPEKWVREERLEERFGVLLSKLTFNDRVYSLIVNALKESFADEKREHAESITSLRGEIDRLRARLEGVYVDKLDGRITEDFYNRMSLQWRDEIDRCQGDIMRHEDASNAYMDEGVALLALSQKAHRLVNSTSGIERRRLLNFVLSNCTWRDGDLHADFRQPFDMLAKTIDDEPPSWAADGAEKGLSENWLPAMNRHNRRDARLARYRGSRRQKPRRFPPQVPRGHKRECRNGPFVPGSAARGGRSSAKAHGNRCGNN